MKLAILLPLSIGVDLASGIILPINRRQQTNPKPLVLTENGVTFEVEVQINNQTFYLIPDTGSSDLWVPVDDFQCIDPVTGSEIPQEACHFGNKYQVPNSTKYVANQTFGVQYGTGIALGKVAYADVTVNGITVKQQKIGLVDRTNDIGDGVGSGVLGLGFPSLTSAHPGTRLDNKTLLMNRAVYDPAFVSMYKEQLVEPWYSFAIERPPKHATSGPGGWLGLGQLPPVTHTDDWAIKPIEVTEVLPDELTGGIRQITLMTLTVDGIVWTNSSSNSSITNSTSFQAVVDTGNHMNLLPVSIAEAINDSFDPPGLFDEELQVYIINCNASTPELGVILDGHTFWQRLPEDLIYHDVGGFCYSSVGRSAEGSGIALNFLGDAFLRNVVSVFDFGKDEMRFAARVTSNSSEAPNFSSTAVRSGTLNWWWASLILILVL